MDSKKVLLAAALAGLALGASAANSVSHAEKEVQNSEGQCHGVNSCKGTSGCHSEKNSCAGQNSCKGKGWLMMSEKACKEKKGTFKKS